MKEGGGKNKSIQDGAAYTSSFSRILCKIIEKKI